MTPEKRVFPYAAPVCLAICVAVGALIQTSRADWPDFRGPFGNGHVVTPGDAKTIGLPLEWSETKNVTWKTAIPEKGWSTAVIMNDQIWMTSATPKGHDYFAICVDKKSGEILFNEKVFHTDTPEPLGMARP